MGPSDTRYAIACAFDESFAIPAAVALRSISIHWKADQPVYVFVLDGGITEPVRRRVEQSVDPSTLRINWCTVDREFFCGLPARMHRNLLSIYRFAVGEVIPNSVERAVWIDVDVMVNRCMAELWHIDLGVNPIAAVQDMAIPWISSPLGLRKSERKEMPENTPYFNSGLVVIDMDKWRDAQSDRRLMRLLKTQPWGVRHQDQHAMNVLYLDNWTALDPRWNVISSLAGRSYYRGPSSHLPELLENPWMVHYAGFFKPWKMATNSPFAKDFIGMLAQCAFPPITHHNHASLCSFYDRYLREVLYPVERVFWRTRQRVFGN